MPSEVLWIAFFSLIGGAGGIVAGFKAFFDYREKIKAHIEDADERLLARLERRLDAAERRISELEAVRAEDTQYITVLTVALAHAGVPVPARP